MINKTKYLLATTAIMACMLQASPSFSDTTVRQTVTESPTGTTIKKTVTETVPVTTSISTTTTTTQHSLSAPRVINFIDFDYNKDGIISVNEVAKTLFRIYDTDDNNIIDSNEYERRIAVTLTPIQKDVVVSYDIRGDGTVEKTYTYETFTQDSLLSRFDKNNDGLSAHEFTGLHFNIADVNKDHAIDLKEWQGSYIPSIDKANKERARLNK